MNANIAATDLRVRRLRALGVERLRLRRAGRESAHHPPAPAPASIRRLALLADAAERRDPAIDRMYTALTEAVSKAGLQPVRVCDVAADAGAAVMVFGSAEVPGDIPALRVIRADPLAILHADRGRKRRLWDQLLALGRGGSP